MSEKHVQMKASRLEQVIVIGLCLVVCAVFGLRTRAQVGSLEFPLDDPYIYLQYARNLASGHGMAYWPGAGYSAGCTSSLYPFLLVPGFLLGLDDGQMVPYVWLLSALLILWCALLTFRLGRVLGGRLGGVCAVAFLLANSAWLWGGLSGLEIGLFTSLTLWAAWLLVADGRGWLWLLVCAAMLSLARPEGLPVALLLVGFWGWRTVKQGRVGRLVFAPVAFLPFAAVAALNLRTAGQIAPNTALYKSVLYSPGQSIEGVAIHMGNHLLTLLHGLILPLDGGLFLLPFGVFSLLLALVWGVSRLRTLGRPHAKFHNKYNKLDDRTVAGAFLLLAALLSSGAALVARGPGQFYRYHHVGLAILSICAGLGAAGLLRHLSLRLSARAAGALALLLGLLFMLAGASQLGRWSALMARAASEIRVQQVQLGHWMDKNLPSDARVLLNDVGAMAYYGKRESFDLVGLTTNHQARWYLEGLGTVFEHFERLEPSELPTHFAIYPDWLGIDALMGRSLFEVEVPDGVMVGGARAVVFEANWSSLHSGDWPAGPIPRDRLLDRVDVADLESERAHDYVITLPPELRGARNQTLFFREGSGKGEKVAQGDRETEAGGSEIADGGRQAEGGGQEIADGGRQAEGGGEEIADGGRQAEGGGEEIADGGRQVSLGESFALELPDVSRAFLRIRARAERSATLLLGVDGKSVGTLELGGGASFTELQIELPGLSHSPGAHSFAIQPSPGQSYQVFHYWLWGE